MEDIHIAYRNLKRYEMLTDKLFVNWNSYGFLYDFLRDNIASYLSILKLFEGYLRSKLENNLTVIECICTKTLQTFEDYIKGRVFNAYMDMKDVFSFANDILKRKSANRYLGPIEFGFKARQINNSDAHPTREEMFHIPFEMRHLVKAYRYSIHGLPSIYLGHSIYDCYIELGSPPLNEFWVSLFSFSQDTKDVFNKNNISLIDMVLSTCNYYRLELLLKQSKNDEEGYISILDRLADDIIIWPLVMACSIPCKYPNADFKQEYIIPQIIYQLCSDYHEFIGIRYVSTKVKCVNKDIHSYAMINYALPANAVMREGHCPRLASQLILTEPITSSQSQDTIVDVKGTFSSNGFPILGNMHKSLANDEIIIFLDKMTVYFDNLIQTFTQGKDPQIIRPLFGWKDK